MEKIYNTIKVIFEEMERLDFKGSQIESALNVKTGLLSIKNYIDGILQEKEKKAAKPNKKSQPSVPSKESEPVVKKPIKELIKSEVQS